jgi:hypothetical protein
VSDISTNSTWVIRHLSIPDKYVSFNRVWYITRFRCIYFIMNKKGRTSLSCGKHERPVLLNEFLTCWKCWIRQHEAHIYVSHKGWYICVLLKDTTNGYLSRCRSYTTKPITTVDSRYVKLDLLEISVKSKFFRSSVLNLVLFNLMYSSYLQFRWVENTCISKQFFSP